MSKLREDIIGFIHYWDARFPLDYWWRKKYSVPFGSKKHREVSLFDMFFEYEEERIVSGLIEKDKELKEEKKLEEKGFISEKEFEKLSELKI